MSAVAALVEENLTRHSLFQSLPMGSTQSQSQALQETHDHGSPWRKGTCRGSVGEAKGSSQKLQFHPAGMHAQS